MGVCVWSLVGEGAEGAETIRENVGWPLSPPLAR